MKNSTRRRILFLFLLAGLGLANYPFISQQINKRSESLVISSYSREAAELSDDTREEMMREARAYNETLAEKTTGLSDAFSGEEQKNETYERILNVDGNGMMGYISIPKINVRLPVYHGISTRVLERGVGHLYETSLPTGGKNTHAVLSSHRGLPSRELFTDLDQLVEGDTFLLYILDETLAYEVDDIRVVKPEETESLEIVPGEDLVTLVTCTPYGVNSHRLLVRGTRIPWEAEAQEPEQQADTVQSRGMGYILKWIFILSIIILVAAGIWLLPPRRDRKEGLRRE